MLFYTLLLSAGSAAAQNATPCYPTTLGLRQQLPHAATAVGIVRVAAGGHLPSDVLAGAALGSGMGWLTARCHPMTA